MALSKTLATSAKLVVRSLIAARRCTMPFVQSMFSCLLACLAAAVDHHHAAHVMRSGNDDCDWDGTFVACKPKFMVLGVQKSGTSSLWEGMKQHPDIIPSKIKEPQYFSHGQVGYDHARCSTDQQSLQDYLTRFYSHANTQMKNRTKSAGEWSATYFHCACCPGVLRAFMPQLKFIVSLRQPIDRAFSRFVEQHTEFHAVPGTNTSFDTYVNAHLPELRRCLQTSIGMQAKTECLGKENVLGLSVYDAPLANWLAVYPKEQFLVTYLDQLDHNPQAELQKIETHLGLRHIQYRDLNQEYNHQGDYGWTQSMVHVPHIVSKPSEDKLVAFYRPGLLNLKRMADAGTIPPLPPSWMLKFSLGMHAAIAISDKGAEDYEEQ